MSWLSSILECRVCLHLIGPRERTPSFPHMNHALNDFNGLTHANICVILRITTFMVTLNVCLGKFIQNMIIMESEYDKNGVRI